ncbi:MAG: thiolase family protein [Archangiaceae bacterium]|nr:thiolase family protein [Archangiaceae bacterium]
MRDVYVAGAFTTRFGRYPEVTHQQLAREALDGVLADARVDGGAIDGVWFGSCALHAFGQANIRGQAVLLPLVREQRLNPTAAIVNVEAGCATGGVALHGAYAAVASGLADVALAIGVEKLMMPAAPQKVLELFEQGIDQLQPQLWRELYAGLAREIGAAFEPIPQRITILDIAALEALWHMKKHGTTQAQLAEVAAKNHTAGAKNPKALQQKALTAEQVLADKPVLAPFTRAMCAPMADGAAAVLLTSKKGAVRLASMGLANGARWRPEETPVAVHAAKRAKVEPSKVELAEVHDATAFAEIAAVEALELGHVKAVNPSGGLIARGHPLAATGLAQVTELTARLRAGEAKTALAHNAGGIIGFDEAMCAISVLQAS